MTEAQEVINKVYEVLPKHIRQAWHEFPLDVDAHVTYGFIRDTLKPGLIRMYLSLQTILEKQAKTLKPVEVSPLLAVRTTLLEGLGLIEVYLYSRI